MKAKVKMVDGSMTFDLNNPVFNNPVVVAELIEMFKSDMRYSFEKSFERLCKNDGVDR